MVGMISGLGGAVCSVARDAGAHAARGSLGQYFQKHDSDKSSRHHYERYYDRWLPPLCAKRQMRMLEIGVEKGKSMNVWQDYFANAQLIAGIGYKNHQRDRKTVDGVLSLYMGDQSDRKFLRWFVDDTGGTFDLIIDDGSHVPSHQKTSFEELWPSVAEGGMYVIEDIETSWWKNTSGIYGYPFKDETSLLEYFQQLPSEINREFSRRTPVHPVDIEAIEYGHNIICIRKALTRNAHLLSQRYKKSRISRLKAPDTRNYSSWELMWEAKEVKHGR